MRATIGVGVVLMVCVAGSSLVLAGGPGETTGGAAGSLLQKLGDQIGASSKADDKLKTFTKEKLLPLCTNEVFVKAIAAQNAKKASLDDIKRIDKEWSEAEDELPIQAELMSNPCAKEIKRIATELSAITESFVMDNQGANVGQNVLTSDYWQGDEPKWQEAFNDGKGGVHFDKPKLDKSTNVVDQKVGLPIVDPDGKVIGAITIGINVDKL